jgi:hypothetical protein
VWRFHTCCGAGKEIEPDKDYDFEQTNRKIAILVGNDTYKQQDGECGYGLPSGWRLTFQESKGLKPNGPSPEVVDVGSGF